ncbi:MAG: ribulose-phosphate 3-epimerase [Tissierellia bacterium]|nr:ribulose-phosphate 3-epimerase [Tissierellia bacterium]
MNILSPSIMTANFLALQSDLDAIEKAGVKFLHLDVMDGNFVPNISFGPKIISDISKRYNFTFDAHLMVNNPENLIEDFAKAGCDYITIHPEATSHVHRQIQLIKSLGKKAGISLNPATPINNLEYLLDDIDLILIMSVNPGFGGQSFIPSIIEKIKQTSEMIKNKNIILEVDGGIKLNNVKEVIEAGATAVVVGSAIFDGIKPEENAREFLRILND